MSSLSIISIIIFDIENQLVKDTSYDSSVIKVTYKVIKTEFVYSGVY